MTTAMPRKRGVFYFKSSAALRAAGEVRMRVIGRTLVLVFVCAGFPVAGQDQSMALLAASDAPASRGLGPSSELNLHGAEGKASVHQTQTSTFTEH
ncbi:MAG: hypothetical protein DMG04_05955 [Acidobacteria bacterium]|nr:MAG: hypothetical protein DMG04_05955 [Acidobacteriota bacterium]PYQ90392.1 MAG: hypothetical protein DMG02_10860 [Acidobacteriota bacterium]